VDDTLELAAVLRRTNELAIETGQLHRVVLDFANREHAIEVCQGAGTLQKGAESADRTVDPRKVADRLEVARQRLSAPGPTAAQPADAEDAARLAAAIAGHHVVDRVCGPAVETPAPGAKRIPKRTLRSEVKFQEVWVQHLDDSVTQGTVTLHFFPNGSAEKSVIVLHKGDDAFTILVHGLTGRVEVKDEKVAHPEDHLLRDLEGNEVAEP